MKTVVLAAVIAITSGAALAGGLSDPVVAPEVVMQDTVQSAGNDDWAGVLVTFLTIVLLGVGG